MQNSKVKFGLKVGYKDIKTIEDLKEADQAARKYVKDFIEDMKEANE